ncbi:asparaginase [Nocardioides aurantiacus]|uniref:asparaginase n=1 Tax=Nocardioides aurantiacus TaxID=86796 RepID=A0A3N2CZB7_9ACTN|nr:asparaginase domain-containing protein [Nocardioides aurantiacus]ROR92885.1 L-asparaginase [Nocardioides aurantiacus]
MTTSRRIVLVGTGGTIASRSVEGAVVARVPAAELLAGADLAGLSSEVTVAALDHGTSPSFALSLDQVAEVALLVLDELGRGADGVVVTHGTDSMEETVLLLDLLHTGDQPVVVTGAQRPFDDPDPDGPRNLGDAVRVAASEEARGHGALLVFDGAAWPAVGVRKVHTSDLHAFEAPAGPRLRLDGVGLTVAAVPGTRGSLPAAAEAVRRSGLAPVDVVATVPGSDGAALAALLDRGTRGIVLQGLGIGNTAPGDTEQVRRAVAAGVPVLLTSRVAHGAVRAVYGGGGGVDLLAAGAVLAGDQTTWQARVLLAAALAVAPDDPTALVRGWLETRTNPSHPSTHEEHA